MKRLTMDLKTLVDDALELAVVPSFTDVGFRLRRSLLGWEDLADLRMDGRVVAITGATSGLGLASARMLSRMGAGLRLLVRDPGRGARLAEELGGDVEIHAVDMSDLSSVRRAVDELMAAGSRLDVLINNAGALLTERRESVDGYEMTFATMVLGPFVLTNGLVSLLERAGDLGPARVITVASGGMYLERVHLDDLQMEREPYRGSVAYARAKRAQVVLTREWARRLRDHGIVAHAMHPGWADTPGVEASLPTFRRIVGPFLRAPEQGADTIVWLAAAEEPTRSTGRFWLDRRPRAVDRLPSTRSTAAERAALWSACERLTAGTGADG
jgi:NAD(P)-dependent dehydrogenase (short-subunit alcohol dehydrogenase family)